MLKQIMKTLLFESSPHFDYDASFLLRLKGAFCVFTNRVKYVDYVIELPPIEAYYLWDTQEDSLWSLYGISDIAIPKGITNWTLLIYKVKK